MTKNAKKPMSAKDIILFTIIMSTLFFGTAIAELICR